MRPDPERDLEKASKHFCGRSCVCACERKSKKVECQLCLRVQTKFSIKDLWKLTCSEVQRAFFCSGDRVTVRTSDQAEGPLSNISVSVLQKPSKKPDWELLKHLQRAENVPHQPGRAWEDLQGRRSEYHHIQLCRACGIKARKMSSCHCCQRCCRKYADDFLSLTTNTAKQKQRRIHGEYAFVHKIKPVLDTVCRGPVSVLMRDYNLRFSYFHAGLITVPNVSYDFLLRKD